MPASFTRIMVHHQTPTPAAYLKELAPILDAYADIGVKHIRSVEWSLSRFRKPTGRSTNAWKSLVNREKLYLTIYNDARSRTGTIYAPYVHLAGRPRTDRLFAEVEAYTGGPLAASIGRASTAAYIRALQTAPVKRTTTRIG